MEEEQSKRVFLKYFPPAVEEGGRESSAAEEGNSARWEEGTAEAEIPASGEKRAVEKNSAFGKQGFFARKGRTAARKKPAANVCAYCGSIHIRRREEGTYGVCEECSRQFINRREDFVEVLTQTRANVEVLLGVVVDERLRIKWKTAWYKGAPVGEKRKNEKDKFGFSKSFLEAVREKTGDGISFAVYEGMPCTLFAYAVCLYCIDLYIKAHAEQEAGIMYLRSARIALTKWFGLYYMYQNGYTDFCRWQIRKESADGQYREWEQRLGSPTGDRLLEGENLIAGLKDKAEEMAKGDEPD